MNRCYRLLASTMAATLCVLASAQQTQKATKLDIGDPAPAFRPARWLKGTPVSQFKKGHVYVVEFWTTWCVPCKEAMPDLSEIARKYKGSVDVIGVDAYEAGRLDQVASFAKAQGPRMDYLVAADGAGGKIGEEWMAAAGEAGIPTAFVVGKDGRIAWIGAPTGLDAVLPKAIAGTLDLQVEQAQRAAQLDPMNAVMIALDARQYQKAVTLLRPMIAKQPNGYRMPLFQALVHTDLTEFENQAKRDIAATKGAPAIYSVVFLALDNDGLPKSAYQFGLQLAEDGLKVETNNSTMLYARGAAMAMRLGDIDKSITMQTQAVKASDADPGFQSEQREALRKDLESYKSLRQGH